MANKVVQIKSNKTKTVRNDFLTKDNNPITDISAQNSYVYMDLNMISQYKMAQTVSLSSIHQTEYVLGTERYRSQQQIIATEGISDEERMKLWLYSRSSLTVTKKIDNFIKKMKTSKLDQSKLEDIEIEGHTVTVYRY